MAAYFRKVFRISAEDSPNVRYALAQQAAGKVPTGETIVPGVLSWSEYVLRRSTWDPVRQCIGLDGKFWKGAEVLLFPPLWLRQALWVATDLANRKVTRVAKGIGVDTAEGGDKTAWAATDEYGLIELVAYKTPDTSVIPGDTLAFMRKHNVKPESVCFDKGGGGVQAADRLRSQGYNVRAVGFGESPALDPQRGIVKLADREKMRETKYAYKTRRAQMYGTLRELLDPANERKFGIPREYADELFKQLGVIPLLYDAEGRLSLPPKTSKRPGTRSLVDIIGHSPDEADALVLAVHAMTHKTTRPRAGAL